MGSTDRLHVAPYGSGGGSVWCGLSHTDSAKVTTLLTISSSVFKGWRQVWPGPTNSTEVTGLLTTSILSLLGRE